MRRVLGVFLVAVTTLVVTTAAFQSPGVTSDAIKGLEMRSLGPSYTTGRVQDITVDPRNASIYYVASAAGGLWKTTNRGQTWTPVFDSGGAFNLCCVVIDPKNSDIVWLGTGENSVPRSAMIGDGLYKSTDAAKTWVRVAIPNSEHIGQIRIDPRDSNVVYVAAQGPLWSSGGDRGVFKTTDGGKTWKAVLTVSEYTGAADVVIDPNNPDVLYAAMWQRQRTVGNMIGGGPESGLYKTTNAGTTWTQLKNGLPTGDVGRMSIGVDPNAKPTRVYALLNGLAGESGFYRSDDAGASFDRMGAPFGKPGTANEPTQPCDVAAGGRRGGGGGAAGAPTGGAGTGATGGGAAGAVNPVQTTPPPPARAGGAGAGAAGAGAVGAGAAGVQGRAGGAGGGRGGCAPGAYCGGDPGYYQEIYVDPVRPDTIWSMNTNLEWSRDGGRCWSGVPNLGGVHVDYHAVWSDPKDLNHILIGNDGGAYESWDEGRTWKHFENLPITQFYRVGVDNKTPFYYVCGGAQDNGSMCGPSRTMASVGIRSSEWFTSGGGDGFFNLIDPEDPNYQYSSSQDGAIVRLDLRTGQSRSIRPQLPPPGQEAGAAGGAGRAGGGGGRGGGERTNWDTPYIISPHSSTRLYRGSQYLYRSDDRGDSWARISPDLTRNLDYREIVIMGKQWDPANTVAYHNATTTLSDIVSIDESPIADGLIYVGTDDGNLQVTEDGGKTWRKTTKFATGPDGVWVTSVFASQSDANVVFVTQNDWQHGNYQPYVWRSDDKGKTFKNIAGDLPGRHPCWSIVQDHVNPNLLFLGTEWGLFVTVDAGTHWTKVTRGLPATAQVRDIVIQKRENDLVVATFGRGFYVLDDISPLREMSAASLARDAELYPLRNAYRYDQIGQYDAMDGNERTPNPVFGAVFTYSVGPTFSGNLVLTITDLAGRNVCRMDVPETPGVSRAAWSLRVGGGGGGRGGGGGGGGRGGAQSINVACSAVATGPDAAANPDPTAQAAGGGRGGGAGGQAGMVDLGRYMATLGKLDNGVVTPVGKPQPFALTPLLPRNWNGPF